MNRFSSDGESFIICVHDDQCTAITTLVDSWARDSQDMSVLKRMPPSSSHQHSPTSSHTMQPTPFHSTTISPYLSPIPPNTSRRDSLTRSSIVFPMARQRRSSIAFPSPTVVGRRSSFIRSTLVSPSPSSVSQVLLPTYSAIPVPPSNPFASGMSRSSFVPRGRRSSLGSTSFLSNSVDMIYTSSPPARIARVVTRVHSPHGRSPPKEFTTVYPTGSPPSPMPQSSSKPPSTMFITP